jgi:hypothetical protein
MNMSEARRRPGQDNGRVLARHTPAGSFMAISGQFLAVAVRLAQRPVITVAAVVILAGRVIATLVLLRDGTAKMAAARAPP